MSFKTWMIWGIPILGNFHILPFVRGQQKSAKKLAYRNGNWLVGLILHCLPGWHSGKLGLQIAKIQTDFHPRQLPGFSVVDRTVHASREVPHCLMCNAGDCTCTLKASKWESYGKLGCSSLEGSAPLGNAFCCPYFFFHWKSLTIEPLTMKPMPWYEFLFRNPRFGRFLFLSRLVLTGMKSLRPGEQLYKRARALSTGAG